MQATRTVLSEIERRRSAVNWADIVWTAMLRRQVGRVPTYRSVIMLRTLSCDDRYRTSVDFILYEEVLIALRISGRFSQHIN